jgi:creatinine amidohydrolase/Fe(II)-dependent formamide hydrolase-like protein
MNIVEYASRSLAAHGFTDILLIGDSSGDPTRATAAYGQSGLEIGVDAALAQIRRPMAGE